MDRDDVGRPFRPDAQSREDPGGTPGPDRWSGLGLPRLYAAVRTLGAAELGPLPSRGAESQSDAARSPEAARTDGTTQLLQACSGGRR